MTRRGFEDHAEPLPSTDMMVSASCGVTTVILSVRWTFVRSMVFCKAESKHLSSITKGMNCACGVSTEVRIVLTVGTCLCRQRNVRDTQLIDVWSVARLTKEETDHLGVSDGKGAMVKIRGDRYSGRTNCNDAMIKRRSTRFCEHTCRAILRLCNDQLRESHGPASHRT